MSKVGRSANREAVEADALKGQAAQDNLARDMGVVISSPPGRRTMLYLLSECGNIGARQTVPLGVDGELNETLMMLAEGRRAIGDVILEMMARADHKTMREIGADLLSIQYPMQPRRKEVNDVRLVEADESDDA